MSYNNSEAEDESDERQENVENDEVPATELGFSIVLLSSQDCRKEETRSKQISVELGGHGDGWTSAPSCPYPQEILLRLKYVCEIESIELVTNAVLVSKNVEIYFGVPKKSSMPTAAKAYPDEDILFRAVSEIFFDEPNGQRQRINELIGAAALFIRILLYESHVTEQNEKNQVGLTTLKLFGRRSLHVGNALGVVASAPIVRRLPRKPMRYDGSSSEDDDERIENMIDRYKTNRSRSNTDRNAAKTNKSSRRSPNAQRVSSIGRTTEVNADSRQQTEVAKAANLAGPASQLPFTTRLAEFNHLIRLMKTKQHDAVRDEKYIEADALKNILVILKQKEAEMDETNAERKIAIQEQDYKSAEKLKAKFVATRDNLHSDVPELANYLSQEEKQQFLSARSNDNSERHKMDTTKNDDKKQQKTKAEEKDNSTKEKSKSTEKSKFAFGNN